MKKLREDIGNYYCSKTYTSDGMNIVELLNSLSDEYNARRVRVNEDVEFEQKTIDKTEYPIDEFYEKMEQIALVGSNQYYTIIGGYRGETAEITLHEVNQLITLVTTDKNLEIDQLIQKKSKGFGFR